MSFKYDHYTDSFIHVKDEEPIAWTVKKVELTEECIDRIAEVVEKKRSDPEHSYASDRYEDLCEYFDNKPDAIKGILEDRKEFKAWLERMHWHVLECDKLGRELEKLKAAQPNVHVPTKDADCISRQAAIDAIHEDADWLASQGSDWQVARMERDKSILRSLPSAQPKTGKWIPQKGGGCCCSECGRYALDEVDGNFIHVSAKSKYCPHCGVMMLKEGDEE